MSFSFLMWFFSLSNCLFHIRILTMKSNFYWPSFEEKKKTKEIERGFSKPVAMEAANSIDHFARIPEDLVVSILSRLENLKDMFGCSLVSKRFASTFYLIKSVSLTLPSTEIPPPASAEKINELFPKLPSFTSEEIIRFIQSSPLKELKFFSFLQNFRELRSISLEFKCPRSVCSSSLFFMRVKFGSGGARVQKFVSFVSDSVCKETEEEPDEEPSPIINELISGTFLPFGCCTYWLLVLCMLVKCQPLLESITITNCKKQGKLVLRDEKLIAWRNSFVPGGLLNDFLPYAHLTGSIPRLHMPESGFVLNGASYMIARLAGESDSDSDAVYDDGDGDDGDDDATTWDYVGDEKLFEDVMCEFLRNYGDEVTIAVLAG